MAMRSFSRAVSLPVALARLCKAVAHNRLRPIIDSAFPMNDAKAAYVHLAARRHVGKIVIDVQAT